MEGAGFSLTKKLHSGWREGLEPIKIRGSENLGQTIPGSEGRKDAKEKAPVIPVPSMLSRVDMRS